MFATSSPRPSIHPATMLVAATACLGSSAAIAAATAMPDCGNATTAHALVTGQGMLESIAFDRSGRILFTDIGKKALQRLDHPGATPVTAAGGISGPGGIAVADDTTAYVGTGNSLNGLFPSLGLAGIVRVNLATGKVATVANGLGMANGLVRASDGTFYASNDLASRLDRVLPDGTVQAGWMRQNSNGMVLSSDEKTLYVNQFLPAKILAVERATGQVRTVAEPPSSKWWALLDGLEIDQGGRLYVAAYLSGEVWRIETDGSLCVLAKGLKSPSALAVGRAGQGFSPNNLYITSHSGSLLELAGVIPSQP